MFIFGLLVAALATAAPTVAQMPDARQMSGIPMPVADVPAGTVVVRLVRGTLTDNIAGHAVELIVADKSRGGTTDASGHAQFDGLTVGSMVRASAVVDGQKIESQNFAVPATGGIRLVLAAGAAAPIDAALPAAAAAGDIVLGGDSRVQIEFDDDSLTVFYIFDVVNAGTAPVTPKREFVFDLPAGAQQPSVLEGSSTQATISGHRVTVAGPFAPGSTPIQIAYGLAPGGASRTINQVLPIGWLRVQAIVTQIPGLSIASAQFTSTGEVPGDTHSFVLGTGGALAPGAEFNMTLNGVPYRSRGWRMLTLALGLLVLAGGAWSLATAGARTADVARRKDLEQRRARLLADVVRIEQQRRAGTIDTAKADNRRAELFAQLDRVYGELDEQGVAGEGRVA
jgi:hypothetical protein